MIANYLRFIRIFCLLFLSCMGSAHAQNPAPRPKLLEALDGQWIMSGDVRGKPVRYTLEAKPALMGSFTELRMQDVQVPAEYAATVFIGHDAQTDSIIVHWMDSFGARYSIPHGTGQLRGNTLQFIFPYSSGQFRDTLTFHPETGHWTFVLESMQRNGTWKHFAKYKVVKSP